jgi:hypothetical protein
VEIITGHNVAFAGIFFLLTPNWGCRSGPDFADKVDARGTCGFRPAPAISAIPLVPIV